MFGFIVFGLVVALLVILLSSEIFTNALEHLGKRWGVSEGVTASLFAAVGTVLPETIVPILAILGQHQESSSGHDIGIGAILGAPLMLSTLSIGLMGLVILKRRGWQGTIRAERSGLRRDLKYFIITYSLAIFALCLPQNKAIRLAWSLVLVGFYLLYVAQTLRASPGLVSSGHATEADQALWIQKLAITSQAAWPIYLQLVLALVLLITGAKRFIYGIELAANYLHLPLLWLSLVIIPIATEFPEKVNSILWIRQNKDTLAVGNITGAMTFQSSLLPALGILFTPWEVATTGLLAMATTGIASLWLFLCAQNNKHLRVWHVFPGLFLYALYIPTALLLSS